jgi:hypothetical protein
MRRKMPVQRNQQRFVKGALVELPVDQSGAPPNPIYFQFNPETLERIKSGQWTSAQSQRQKAQDAANEQEFRNLRNKKVKAGFMPQPEKINFTLRLDASERALRAPQGSNVDISEGILPELAALENLMKEARTDVAVGGSKNAPTLTKTKEIPLVLFIWGDYRVMPVTILSMTITEQKFDYLLNPVRAEIRISMQVLEEEDAKLNEQAYRSFEYTQSEKDRMKNAFVQSQQKANQWQPLPSGYPVQL